MRHGETVDKSRSNLDLGRTEESEGQTKGVGVWGRGETDIIPIFSN